MADLATLPDVDSRYERDLQRVLRDAVVNGYHACDESVPAMEDPPRGGCRCWVSEARLLIPDLGE